MINQDSSDLQIRKKFVNFAPQNAREAVALRVSCG